MSDSHVYVQCKKHHWVPARIVEKRKDSAVVSVPHYRDEQSILSDAGKGALKYVRKTVKLSSYTNAVLPLQNVDEMGWLDEEKDMVNLPFLHEAAILYNLKSRHTRGKPYTRTGDIVIAVNPYEWFDHLYTPAQRREYAEQLLWNAKPGSDARQHLEPHVYETSTLAFKGLAEGTHQSILVSGESGAGKTETVKICMNHIAMIQNGNSNTMSGGSDHMDAVSDIVKRIVDSNPLLETFGNAKTRRNDNSSRFGKYLQLQFRTEDRNHDPSAVAAATTTTTTQKNQFSGDRPWENCRLVGSKCEVYLLETNRVIRHDKEERNFHIMYQLLASADAVKGQFWPGLKGKTAESFKYVGASSTKSIEGMSDAEHFESTIAALSLVDIKGSKLKSLMQAMAAVLQLGNIEFSGCKDKSKIKNTKDLGALVDLIGVPIENATGALTQRTMVTRGETMKVNLGVEVAQDSRDALAKAIYNESFKWLVREINRATAVDASTEESIGLIGLLDIFGFESFQQNGFEQLCINYANEKLQQKFTQDIFRQVQAEYESEGLALDDIRYEDNHDLLYMVESRMGLLAMLNEECMRPGGCDKEFVYKAIQQNGSSPSLIVDKRHSPLEFGIRHYAGDVIYTAGSFVAKNNDTLLEDLRACAGKSSNPIIQGLAANPVTGKTGATPSNKRRNSAVAAATVWTKYKSGLTNLMAELRQTNSRYIRCIKPNNMKKPSIMQHGPTLDQLRSAGVISAVTITRSAFPNRLDHASVIDRFWHISKVGKVSSNKGNLGKEVERLLGPLLADLPSAKGTSDGSSKAYAVGKTKTYFRAGTLEFLETERVKGFDPAAMVLQKVARGFLVRKRKHNSYIEHRHACTEIQRISRGFLSQLLVRAMREQRMNCKERNAAATKINALARGVVRRLRFRSELQHYRQVTSMKLELETLQHKVVESEEQKVVAVKAAEDQVRAALEMLKEEKSTGSNGSGEAQRLMKERNAQIEKLRSDNKRVRATIKLLEGKYKRLREELRKKKEENEKTTKEFLQLNEDAKAKNEENTKAVKNQAIWKQQSMALVEEMKKSQTSFGTVANGRVQYQGVMADILKLLRTKCRQEQLIEDAIFIALDSDTEVKAIRASFEAVQAHQAEKGKGIQVPSTVGNSSSSQHDNASTTATETSEGDVSEMENSSHSLSEGSMSSTEGEYEALDVEDLTNEEAEMEAEFQALTAEVEGL